MAPDLRHERTCVDLSHQDNMTKLTTKTRKSLPGKDFALPGRRYPIEDKAHASNAKARATQEFEAGKLSADDRAKIDAKADAVLGRKDR